MKNLYNITKGQLIVLWVFALCIMVWTMDKDDMGSEWAGLVGIVTLFAIIFYTVGWRNKKKEIKN